MLIAIGCIIGGAVSLLLSFTDSAKADEYRAATECPTTFVPGTNCYMLNDGTITRDVPHIGRTATSDDVTVTTADGTLAATLRPAPDQDSRVRSGAAVRAKVYRGALVSVVIDGKTIVSDNDPERGQSTERILGIIFIAVGAIALVVRLVWPPRAG